MRNRIIEEMRSPLGETCDSTRQPAGAAAKSSSIPPGSGAADEERRLDSRSIAHARALTFARASPDERAAAGQGTHCVVSELVKLNVLVEQNVALLRYQVW